MTIYAIVNNLVKEHSSANADNATWVILSPSGILQGGNPYFVPDFSNHFEARLALAVKIGKLGKGVAPRFVHRYVDTVAPALVFVASDMLASLRDAGLPWTQAISYDKCTALGKFTNIPYEDIENCKVGLRLSSSSAEMLTEWSGKDMNPCLETAISQISRDNTLKTGDIILLGLSAEGPEVRPDLRAVLMLNGAPCLKFNIR
ncbi:MAG: fumarylacetoacetate hydrolase family protein [Muribaculaceae bacterium]|nr:fumarylacetoacetate hydrolase family protein [Muribaculaceae bacterium]